MEGQPLINLVKHNGRDSIALGDVFPSIKATTQFLQQYNYINDKCVHPVKGKKQGGKKRTYVCSDSSSCKWRAVINRRKVSATENEYEVTEPNDQHSDSCTSYRKPTQKLLEATDSFAAAVTTNKTANMSTIQA
ncbi:hypothetical protein PHYSODRAFT_476681 [Phytophthora sojae]|uniref:Transposase MuDR plant domain-containing protein n=1 Tax=Phytophthora sojae (strain P6497) TaxID=1094619 RepID=G4YMZ0_PHYSP|nr:hypothetical protein PHYSODRAFT_476681 [Phytophthora sojae]EGZ29523.1 hypothetical protein PHYSODRAFT_476681 [Phytophthora sojae]|eukprot:XP_009516798.1 hypothetical protein PHYSODRAFT_476681 [Phytophthora sojae]